MTEDLLEEMVPDLLILGVHAVDSEGMTESSLEIARVKKKMIDLARGVVLLADSTKFNIRAFAHVAGLDSIDELITDRMPTGTSHEQMTRLKIEITVV